MKTKETKWYDYSEGKIKYGIAVYFNNSWSNVSIGNIPLLFDSKKECDAKRAEIRKMKEEEWKPSKSR